jgi:hypothetical protein
MNQENFVPWVELTKLEPDDLRNRKEETGN